MVDEMGVNEVLDVASLMNTEFEPINLVRMSEEYWPTWYSGRNR